MPPNFNNPGLYYWPDLLAVIKKDLDVFVSHYDTVKTMEEYEALTDKTAYDIIAMQMGSIAPSVIEH